MSLYQIKGLRENATGGFDESMIPEPNPYHGIQAAGAITFDNSSHVVTIASGTNTYWYKGTRYTTSSAITCDLDSYITIADNTTYYVWFEDATGTLKADDAFWDLYEKVPVCTVFWNSSAGAVVNELHGYRRSIPWHINHHLTSGTEYLSGLGQTNPTTTNDALLQIESGEIIDEDLRGVISQQTTARALYKASASVYTWANISLPYTGSSGAPTFLDTDNYTLATFASNNYGCYWVYAINDTERPIYIIPTQAATAHANINAARAEAVPNLADLNLNAEMKLLYRWIYSGDGQYVEAADYRLSAPLPNGSLTSVAAVGVTFAPTGDIASTNVQSAIVELDTEKLAVANKASSSDINTGTEDTKYVTSKGITDSNVAFVADIPVKATGTELNTATDDAKFATAKALKDGEFIGIHVGTTAPADTTKLWLDTN